MLTRLALATLLLCAPLLAQNALQAAYNALLKACDGAPVMPDAKGQPGNDQG